MWSEFVSGLHREIEFLRSSAADLALISIVPLLLLGIVSIQMSDGVLRDLPIVIVNEDGGAISRELTRRLDASPGLSVIDSSADLVTAKHWVREREALLVVYVASDLSRRVLRREPGVVTVLSNASYSTASGAATRSAVAVIQEFSHTLAAGQFAAIPGRGELRPPPIATQTTVLFNPQGSYELQLVGLLQPALLHLIFMVAVVSALGRELRDGTIGAWLGQAGPGRAATKVAGKLALYLIVFMAWALAATLYMSVARGWPVAGSTVTFLAAYLAMYLAYSGIALLLVGLTKSMAQSLSITGIFAGASFAFAGAIFPIESASMFARIWSMLLPYTAFAKVWAEQFVMGAPVLFSVRQILVMTIFLIVGLAVGLRPYIRSAHSPSTWGKR